MSKVLSVTAFAAVGGVLFGLDQGNWGGAIIKEEFVEAFCHGTREECSDASRLPEAYAQFLSLGSSLLQLGAAVGAVLLAPALAQRHGRQEAMFSGSLLTIAGCIPQAIATYPPHFLCARFLSGMGVGIVTYALPMFVSEIAPADMRGVLGCFMQLTMVCGTVVASVFNCQSWFGYQESFALPAIPAFIVAAGIFCFPTSPRFALVQGMRLGLPDGGSEKAWKALRYLRGSDEAADEELDLLKESLADEATDAPWSALWKDASIARRIFLANLLQWMQQLTGVNAILSYGPAIFQSTNVPLSALSCAVVTNGFNLAGTLVMMTVIDRLGRRWLLLAGAASMFLFMTGSAWLAHAISETPADDPVRVTLGWSLLACICLYMASFAIAWGGVPWVYPSEIFPMAVKEKAMSTSVCSQWTANFFIAYIVPQQVQKFEVCGTFLFYSCCLLVNGALVYALIPETKGLELEEMEALFGGMEARALVRTTTPSSVPRVDSHACSLSELAALAGNVSSNRAPAFFGRGRAGSDPYRSLTKGLVSQVLRSSSEGDMQKLYEKGRWRATARVRMSRTGAVALL